MKALYRFLLMLLLALPALNVLAASLDMAAANKVTMAADCMAQASHVACHQPMAGKLPSHSAHAQDTHGMLCSGAGCMQHCAPSLFAQQIWSAIPVMQVGIFIPTQPAVLTSITLSPPHRPPLPV
jgi:hypothetical protein